MDSSSLPFGLLPPPPAHKPLESLPIPYTLPTGDEQALVSALAGSNPPLPPSLMRHQSDVCSPKAPSLRCAPPTVENVVATADLSCELDLKKIALQARNSEYNPKRFPGLIIRIREPKTTALIFRTGKIVCMGAKSESDAETATRKYAKIVKRVGFDVKFRGFKVQNMVALADVRFPVNLERLHAEHRQYCVYDPEIFPGLVYRLERLKVVALVFCNGKVIITGAKAREHIASAFERVLPVLSQFRKLDPVAQ